MLNRHAATARLARQIRSTESAVTQAFVETTGLLHTAALAQQEVGGAPHSEAHAFFLRLNKMVGELVGVQADARRSHGQLIDISRVVNGPETPEECPDDLFTGAELVSDAA